MGGWQRSYTLDRKRFASLILSDFQVALKMYHYPSLTQGHCLPVVQAAPIPLNG